MIGLDGSLGMGKTIFAKGVAEFLQISETITSPTYSYIEEYEYHRHGQSGRFYHLDVWKINTPAEFYRLEVPELLQPGNVIVIEWYQQVAAQLQPLIDRARIPLLTIEFTQTGSDRQLIIHDYEN